VIMPIANTRAVIFLACIPSSLSVAVRCSLRIQNICQEEDLALLHNSPMAFQRYDKTCPNHPPSFVIEYAIGVHIIVLSSTEVGEVYVMGHVRCRLGGRPVAEIVRHAACSEIACFEVRI